MSSRMFQKIRNHTVHMIWEHELEALSKGKNGSLVALRCRASFGGKPLRVSSWNGSTAVLPGNSWVDSCHSCHSSFSIFSMAWIGKYGTVTYCDRNTSSPRNWHIAQSQFVYSIDLYCTSMFFTPASICRARSPWMKLAWGRSMNCRPWEMQKPITFRSSAGAEKPCRRIPLQRLALRLRWGPSMTQRDELGDCSMTVPWLKRPRFPRQRSAQFWDPSLERAFALLQLTMEVPRCRIRQREWSSHGISLLGVDSC